MVDEFSQSYAIDWMHDVQKPQSEPSDWMQDPQKPQSGPSDWIQDPQKTQSGPSAWLRECYFLPIRHLYGSYSCCFSRNMLIVSKRSLKKRGNEHS